MRGRVAGFTAAAAMLSLCMSGGAFAAPTPPQVVTSGAPLADNFVPTALAPVPETADIPTGSQTALYPPLLLPDGLAVHVALCTTLACQVSSTNVPAALIATTLAGRIVWRHSFLSYVEQGSFAFDGPWWEGGRVAFAIAGPSRPLQLVALDPATGAVVHRTATSADGLHGVDGGYVVTGAPAQDGTVHVRYLAADGTTLWSAQSYHTASVVASTPGLLLVMTDAQSGAKALATEWAINPRNGRILWQVTGTTVPYGTVAGRYLVAESTTEPPPGLRAVDNVVVWSLANRQLAWQAQQTDWDTVFSGHNNLNVVADEANLYGCVSPWAIGRSTGAAYCTAYSLASGRRVRSIALPDLPRHVVVEPLAVSRRYLLVAVREGPWTCKEVTPSEKPLVACKGEHALTVAVPLNGGPPIVASGAALPYAQTYALAGARYLTLVSGTRAWLW